MDFVLEFLVELIFEGMYEGIGNKRVPMWLRVFLAIIFSGLCLGAVALFVYLAFISSGIIEKLLCTLIAVLLLVFLAKTVIKAFKKSKTNKKLL